MRLATLPLVAAGQQPPHRRGLQMQPSPQHSGSACHATTVKTDHGRMNTPKLPHSPPPPVVGLQSRPTSKQLRTFTYCAGAWAPRYQSSTGGGGARVARCFTQICQRRQRALQANVSLACGQCVSQRSTAARGPCKSCTSHTSSSNPSWPRASEQAIRNLSCLQPSCCAHERQLRELREDFRSKFDVRKGTRTVELPD